MTTLATNERDTNARDTNARDHTLAVAHGRAELVPRARLWIERNWLILRVMFRQAAALDLAATAASLSFLSLVAIVPIASVALLVLASVPAFAELRDRLQEFLASNLLLPQVADAVSDYVNQFAAAAGQLSMLGLAFFALTAFSTLLTVDRTLNRIWRSARPRSMLQRLALYWATLTAGPLLLAGLVALQLRLNQTATDYGLQYNLHASFWLPWLVTTLLLALGFRVIPNRAVRMRDALIGAGSAALLLELLKWLMGLYVTSFPTYQVVYGAFSVLPVFLLWLYAVWVAVLFGALMAANFGFADTDGVVVRGPRDEFERARTIVELVAAAGPGGSVEVRSMARLFGHSAAVADRVGAALSRLGYVVRAWPVHSGSLRSQVWNERWFVTPGLQQHSLRPLYRELWHFGRLQAPDGRIEESTPPDDEMLDAPIIGSDGRAHRGAMD